MNEYLYDDLYVGQEESFVTKITTQKEDDFRKITGDNNPLLLTIISQKSEENLVHIFLLVCYQPLIYLL